ncbi:MAG: CRTAC1 family protein, partial [Burkholderiaceae bacterium]
PPVEFATVLTGAGVRVTRAPFRPASAGATPTFLQHEGPALGLTVGWRYDVRDYSDPFWIGRGTASGDFNRDGWQDIAFGSDDGVLIYVNRGGRFEAAPLRNAQDNHLKIYAVAFVDMDNDGWPDLVITSFNHGNFVLYNQGGEFDYAQRVALPNNAGILTVSPAFADIDGNGLLDVVNGNMALGVVTGSHQMARGRANSVLFNGGKAGFRDTPLEIDSGETMSTLVSDLNNDGRLDLYFGNDFIAPDRIMLATANGFKAVNAQGALLARTPFFSMSADTADIDNDLQLDLLTFGTTSTAKSTGKTTIDGVLPATYMQAKWTAATCDTIGDAAYRDQCRRVRETNFLAGTAPVKSVDVERCKSLGDAHQVNGCLLVAMWHLITNHSDPRECKTRFGADALIGEVCAVLGARGRLIVREDGPGALPQGDANFVYRFDGQAFVDINRDTPDAFVHPGGWTWNAKFADLDNDGYQDIFNAEGAVRGSGYGFNVFMRNVEGKRFEQRQFSHGLVEDFGIYSFTFVDYDNDGDLDIIANGAVGPVRVFENRATQQHHSLAVSLNDGRGNRSGIGAKVFIRYAGSRGQQVREIKAGGGYMSFDAPVAFFGLGKEDHIDQIRVRWPDGTETSVQGPFAAGYHYRVERH